MIYCGNILCSIYNVNNLGGICVQTDSTVV